MGRPLHKKYFGNTDTDGIGGEGIDTITVTAGGTGYTTGDVVTISAPDLPNGVQAVATVVDDGAGAVASVTITEAGSGYVNAPTITFATGNADATGTATLTTSEIDAIVCNAYIGGASLIGDIVKQRSARRFRVETANGTADCKLVPNEPSAENEMRIKATDSAGGTYYISKISGRTCTVVRDSGTQFEDGAKVGWNIDSAIADHSVVINNG